MPCAQCTGATKSGARCRRNSSCRLGCNRFCSQHSVYTIRKTACLDVDINDEIKRISTHFLNTFNDLEDYDLTEFTGFGRRYRHAVQDNAHSTLVLLSACAGTNMHIEDDFVEIYNLLREEHPNHARYSRISANLPAAKRVDPPAHLDPMPDEPDEVDPDERKLPWHDITTEFTDYSIQTGSETEYNALGPLLFSRINSHNVRLHARNHVPSETSSRIIYFVTHMIFIDTRYGVLDPTDHLDYAPILKRWFRTLCRYPYKNMELLCEIAVCIMVLTPDSVPKNVHFFVATILSRCGNTNLMAAGNGYNRFHHPRVDRQYEVLHTNLVVLLMFCKYTQVFDDTG